MPIGSGGGAALRFLASVLEARAVVEIGTGTGVSGVWLLRGMRSDGVLTTVDIEAEHQRLAKESFAEAGIPRPAGPHHLRRGARRPAAADRRPLRPGLLRRRQGASTTPTSPRRCGCCVRAASWRSTTRSGTTGSPTRRSATTRPSTIRELGKRVADDDDLVSVLLPVGDGLLVGQEAVVARAPASDPAETQ